VTLEGTIVEDRGNIGYQGRRLYRLKVEMGPDTEDFEMSVPAEFLTLVAKAPGEPRNGRAKKRRKS
jgi:hypothetical protein